MNKIFQYCSTDSKYFVWNMIETGGETEIENKKNTVSYVKNKCDALD